MTQRFEFDKPFEMVIQDRQPWECSETKLQDSSNSGILEGPKQIQFNTFYRTMCSEMFEKKLSKSSHTHIIRQPSWAKCSWGDEKGTFDKKLAWYWLLTLKILAKRNTVTLMRLSHHWERECNKTTYTFHNWETRLKNLYWSNISKVRKSKNNHFFSNYL